MRGRKPVPTIVKRARGNPGKRPLNTDEPEAVPGLPECPSHLTDEARKEWERMGAQLASEQRMALVYKGAFAAYCQAWGRWVEAETMLKEYGLVVKDRKGLLARSPYLAIADTAWSQIMKAVAELGISPTSQARVSTVKQSGGGSASNPYLAALKGGRSA